MELPSWIDEDIFYSFGFWFLVVAGEISFILGFSAQSLWGEMRIPFFTRLVLLLVESIIAYLVALRLFNR